MTAPTPALALEAAVRRHRGGRGLGPVSLAAAPGETLGVMGHNGAGKTTLLRLAATLDRPQQGAVRWFGSASPRTARARLGVALDAAEEEGSLSGRQAAHFWCSQWTGAARARPLVAASLERLGLAGVADEPVVAYSFGMRRRLALVAALAHVPPLALLDEPTAGLDPEGAATLRELCQERAAAGATTVVASNDAGFVAAACDRVAFLRAGELVHCGPPSALLEEAGAALVVELELAGNRTPAAAGLGTVEPSPAGATVRLRAGISLAALVEAADRPPGTLRALRVRGATLADAYARLTGWQLDPADAPP